MKRHKSRKLLSYESITMKAPMINSKFIMMATPDQVIDAIITWREQMKIFISHYIYFTFYTLVEIIVLAEFELQH